MRIGLDYRPALQNREGIGRYARELVRGFVELGLDSELGLFGYTLAAMRFSREELGLARSKAELLRLRLPSKWLPGLLRTLGKGVDDLVGGADVYHHTQPNVLPVRRAAEVATIFDCIFMLPDSGYLDADVAERMTAAAREQVRRAKRILVPSQYVGAEVVMALGAHPARVAVTELGCDHIARSLPPEGFGRAREPYVLTVARVDPRKNHLRMLRAFELLVREGLPQRWIVAGPRGHAWEEFATALERSPAKARVQWIVDAPEAELPRLYAQADCFLFASLNEGFGLPPLEAMACGAPVVSSCVTSLPEVCGDAAFLVEPTDVERIFEATRRVLVEPELAAELRARGRAQARKFTWRECAKHTLLAYRKALEPQTESPKLRHTL
ncbi:MAG: glycosyltransferase family 4 protein [Planctomycetes bacterium]|nr:glycosyltransferase family 4 protein [Planctomycetota bacterium]